MFLFLKILAGVLLILVVGLWFTTILIARDVEKEFPPVGQFLDINGGRLHFVDTGKVSDHAAPAVVFLHGASGNLNDPMSIFRNKLEGKVRMIFPDRPGQGYSDSFEGSNDPKMQAKSIAGLLTALEIEKAIIVGHSFGGVITGAFGVLHPEKTAGLIFLAPVSHPWTTGVDWHYDVANTPVIGWLFSNLLAVPAGSVIYPKAVKNVFAPNPMPEDYKETSATRLILRPSTFHENAKDVARVLNHVLAFHHRYKEIKAPTYIIHGDQDDIVSPEIHSINGLSKDIEGSKLTILKGVGHKPDYIARNQIVEAIQEIASR